MRLAFPWQGPGFRNSGVSIRLAGHECPPAGADPLETVRPSSNTHGVHGATVSSNPSEIGGRRPAQRSATLKPSELRAVDPIRRTRNHKGPGLVNIAHRRGSWGMRNGQVSRIPQDGRTLTLTPGDPYLRHLDHAWAPDRTCRPGATLSTT